MSSRTITRPYAPPREITSSEAKSYADRILADSYTAIPRDQLEELAQWVLMLDAEPHDEVAMLRKALTATYQRLDEVRSELVVVRAENLDAALRRATPTISGLRHSEVDVELVDIDGLDDTVVMAPGTIAGAA